MNFSFTQIISTFIVLFAIIDILGAIPIIMAIKQKGEKIYPLKATVIALAILLLFLFSGDAILRLFSVNIESFAVAGSIVIFIYAAEMLLDVEIFRNKGPEGSSSIVPLAFPLIAGPASFSTLLSLRAEYAIENIVIGLVLNMILVYVVLQSTDKIQKIMGEAGVYVIRKFFGIILLAIAVKLFTTNIGMLIK